MRLPSFSLCNPFSRSGTPYLPLNRSTHIASHTTPHPLLRSIGQQEAAQLKHLDDAVWERWGLDGKYILATHTWRLIILSWNQTGRDVMTSYDLWRRRRYPCCVARHFSSSLMFFWIPLPHIDCCCFVYSYKKTQIYFTNVVIFFFCLCGTSFVSISPSGEKEKTMETKDFLNFVYRLIH